MKLRNKDMKKYLLSVAVSTFVAHVVPAVFFHGEVNAGIAQTICCLLYTSDLDLAYTSLDSLLVTSTIYNGSGIFVYRDLLSGT